MSIYKNARFSDIEFKEFIRGRGIETNQDILLRDGYLSFSRTLQDYNVLTHIFDKQFYRVPYTTRMLVEGDRLDNLASDAYGDPDFWWLLAKYNRIIDPRDITSLAQIKIPSKTYIFSYLVKKTIEWR
jgi:hypothetical protein